MLGFILVIFLYILSSVTGVIKKLSLTLLPKYSLNGLVLWFWSLFSTIGIRMNKKTNLKETTMLWQHPTDHKEQLQKILNRFLLYATGPWLQLKSSPRYLYFTVQKGKQKILSPCFTFPRPPSHVPASLHWPVPVPHVPESLSPHVHHVLLLPNQSLHFQRVWEPNLRLNSTSKCWWSSIQNPWTSLIKSSDMLNALANFLAT